MGGAASTRKNSGSKYKAEEIEEQPIEPCNVKTKYQWTTADVIGSGSFATVYRAELIDQGRTTIDGTVIPRFVAIKVIDKSNLSSEDIPHLKEECEIMEQLSHPNCVRLFEHFDDETMLYLVLELAAGGELFDSIINKGHYSEIEAAHAVRQMALALAYLAEKKIVHRDVKPENLIYASNEPDAVIKLTDYGLAKNISAFDSDSPLNDACGTPGYVAPELLLEQPYGTKVDVWAMGVILYILLCGYPPFHEDTGNQSKLFRKIKNAQFEFHSPWWDNVSQAAKDLVRKLLTLDPSNRPTAAEVLLEPWVADPDAQSSADLGAHVIEGIKNVKNQRFKAAVNKLMALSIMNPNILKDLQRRNAEEIETQTTIEPKEENYDTPKNDKEISKEALDDKEINKDVGSIHRVW